MSIQQIWKCCFHKRRSRGEEDDVKLITLELCNAIIQSVYKPPNKPFLLPPLQQGTKPHVVIGDFNSHNTLWGYSTTGTDGEAVEQWAESSNLSLIHDAKLPKSFNSTRWKKGCLCLCLFSYI